MAPNLHSVDQDPMAEFTGWPLCRDHQWRRPDLWQKKTRDASLWLDAAAQTVLDSKTFTPFQSAMGAELGCPVLEQDPKNPCRPRLIGSCMSPKFCEIWDASEHRTNRDGTALS